MEDNKEKIIKINLDPVLYGVSNVNIAFDEEEFVLTMFSGNQARRFVVSPKHAKRILLLLQKQISEYEKQFGKLETKLPEKPGTEKQKPLGFRPENKNIIMPKSWKEKLIEQSKKAQNC